MSVSRVWPNENGLRVFIVQTDLTLDSSGPVSDVPFEQLDWAYRYADSRLQKAADAFNQEEILAELNQAFANQTTKDKLRTHMILLQVMVGNLSEILLQRLHDPANEALQLDFELENRLHKIAEKRAVIIRNMMKKKGLDSIPRKYTEFVQISKRLFENLKKDEAELVKNLFSIQSQIDEFWQTYSSI
jgi:hypothetical protein